MFVALAIGNILSNRIVPDEFYVPTNLSVAAAVYVIARRHVGPAALGLHQWKRGAVWGGTVVAVGLVVFLAAAVIPGPSDLFHDSRVDGGWTTMVYAVFLRIPFGTVVLEELAFRGAVPALLATRMSTMRAVVWASALFGLWHVLPALSLNEVNPVLEALLGDGLAGKVGGVVFGIIGTFLVGLWMNFLRYRSGSLLAPVIAHIGSNSGAYLLAWIITGGGIAGSIDLA